MATKQIILELPDELFIISNKNKEELTKEILIEIAIKYFKEKKLSLEKAASIASLPRIKFLEILSQRKITIFDYGAEEIERELRGIKKLEELNK